MKLNCAKSNLQFATSKLRHAQRLAGVFGLLAGIFLWAGCASNYAGSGGGYGGYDTAPAYAPPTRVCPDCEGTGKASLNVGELPDNVDAATYVWPKCKTCGGTGKVY
jgi:hypothetical protein